MPFYGYIVPPDHSGPLTTQGSHPWTTACRIRFLVGEISTLHRGAGQADGGRRPQMINSRRASGRRRGQTTTLIKIDIPHFYKGCVSIFVMQGRDKDLSDRGRVASEPLAAWCPFPFYGSTEPRRGAQMPARGETPGYGMMVDQAPEGRRQRGGVSTPKIG
jgi:hypothetical protein